jgi:EF-P beta-lysylation protein EpmB
MIQRTPVRIEARAYPEHEESSESISWQQILAGSVTCPAELLKRLGLCPDQWLAGADAGHLLFPIRVPDPFLARMEYGNPDDPLLRQVLPLIDETRALPGFVNDPLAEADAMATTGLIRKYKSRALLMVTGQCAINCRYCFRRHFPYNEQRLNPQDRQNVLDALTGSPEINEVIFSGGDPLAANDKLLAQWAQALDQIPHLRRLRIHTRLPVVIPQRVCDSLLQWIGKTRLRVVVVLHVNHPAEIDQTTEQALQRLAKAGVTLLNQSVILRGVNDNADVLEQLSERLFDAGVLPYYLHAFDPVAGAHHFAVSDSEAKALTRILLERLPGFLVPRLVRELPGAGSKTPLDLD